MIFIGGISSTSKLLNFVQTLICPNCKKFGQIEVFMTYSYFSFFFIPLFKWGKKYYAKSSCCNSIFSLSKEIGQAIEKNENITIHEADLCFETSQGGSCDTNRENDFSIHCRHCGFLLYEEFAFCPKCGKKI